MKILKLRLPAGYKMLCKGFEINFLTKTRIDKSAPNQDLIWLEDNIPYPIETIFVGRNSSGKSTVIEAIGLAIDFFENGRISGKAFSVGELFSLDVIFYHAGKLYHYVGNFEKPQDMTKPFLNIVDEALATTVYSPSYKKDFSNARFSPSKEFAPNVGGDTSQVARLLSSVVGLYLRFNTEEVLSVLSTVLTVIGTGFSPATAEKLVRLFDDSIEYIRPRQEANEKGTFFEFKRIGKDPMNVDLGFLRDHLSDGTLRGIAIYGISMMLFQSGGTLAIDEIERCFHKNLIGNLIMMFTDSTINVAKATLVYSTHYSELLDQTDRTDNINVLHREGNTITLKNMATDYKVRTQMLRSAQFDQNAFDNLINYDYLMDLKREMRRR